MRKVAVHLKNIVVITLQRPLKTCYICRAEPELSRALDNMQTPRELLLSLTHHGCRAIGRAIVNNEHIKLAIECHNDINHTRDILNLVIGGYDYKFFHTD